MCNIFEENHMDLSVVALRLLYILYMWQRNSYKIKFRSFSETKWVNGLLGIEIEKDNNL